MSDELLSKKLTEKAQRFREIEETFEPLTIEDESSLIHEFRKSKQAMQLVEEIEWILGEIDIAQVPNRKVKQILLDVREKESTTQRRFLLFRVIAGPIELDSGIWKPDESDEKEQAWESACRTLINEFPRILAHQNFEREMQE